MSEQHPVVKGRTFEPPGKGPWELESTHAVRPMTPLAQSAFLTGFKAGFSEGTARYGVLLSHLEAGFSQGFCYNQPVAVAAPPGATGTPPKLVLQVVSRIHPEMRRRHKAAERAIREELWSEDMAHWDESDKPAAIRKHQAIQAVYVVALSDAELAAHIDVCAQHGID